MEKSKGVFDEMRALDFDDVLILPQRTNVRSRAEVSLFRKFTFKYAPMGWSGVPIVSSNMDTVTTKEVMAVMHDNSMLAAAEKHASYAFGGCIESAICTLGMNSSLPDLLTDFICLDVANGGMQDFAHFVEKARTRYPNKIIIAGNVVTSSLTYDLLMAGADIVKVGLGSGTVCTTRKMTGVGVPQLHALQTCCEVADACGGLIMSDGGCREPGDVCKAFAAGADFVMLGGLLAGCEENGIDFYGMASKTANQKYHGGLASYKAAEGMHVIMPTRGPLQHVLDEIQGGLRSCCSYVGARMLEELPVRARFIQV